MSEGKDGSWIEKSVRARRVGLDTGPMPVPIAASFVPRTVKLELVKLMRGAAREWSMKLRLNWDGFLLGHGS